VSAAVESFHPATRAWVKAAFAAPTEAQDKAWPLIATGQSMLLLAPTGSGKTLAAFLSAIDKLAFTEEPAKGARCRVLYISPLKALAVDIERNLRAPLIGIVQQAERLGVACRTPSIGLRTGDTSAGERARLARNPPDILITTPESLYLMLTSEARSILRSVDTVIVDEIHAMLPSKRGAHLFVSLERLETLRGEGAPPLQRIGLSATQKTLEDVSRLLGGLTERDGAMVPRPVAVADARAKKNVELTIEVPVDDMAQLGASDRPGAVRGDSKEGGPSNSIWPSIHPRLVELIKQHRSTMVFVNSRRLAERLAAALNDLSGEDLARAHHGSVAREERQIIEERLKNGTLPCIVATSSLELGLDLGSVDLVVQVEAPPSVASGLQRIGRASHHVGGVPKGTVFPKHRADLLASAAVARRMRDAALEHQTYPRSPLDVLAQQIVAIVSVEETKSVDALYAEMRCAAPFAELGRASFEAVLDMLSGRYPADEFAELRPRITWDRIGGLLHARRGSKRLAVVNAGTIPDRGLYGVFLDPGNEREGKASRRVGELDEEMVFEAREGEVFILGASSWRISEITHDRVLVTPAPGQPGKMPFWHGDRLGRSPELGEAIGALSRRIETTRDDQAVLSFLSSEHDLDPRAAKNLLAFVRDQTTEGELPTDRMLPIERFVDEVGDHRVCILSPLGARVHAPLATAIAARARDELGIETDAVWSDDGIVLRFPESFGEGGNTAPDVLAMFPKEHEVEELLVRTLSDTALFASRFRECAGRALLLPKRQPGKRSPLWAQRKRAADLLSVASRYPQFPMVLESYRECLNDVFDLPALRAMLGRIESGALRTKHVDVSKPTPFAASLLFSYIGTFIYDQDAPLAERRAAALAIDTRLLGELLGQVDAAELLDLDSLELTERHLGRLGDRAVPRDLDPVHDLLLVLGELSVAELRARTIEVDRAPELESLLATLVRDRRAVRVEMMGVTRHHAAEDAARYRDALGLPPPAGLPHAFLEPTKDALVSLVSRWARTHGPFRVADLVSRWGVSAKELEGAIKILEDRGRVVRGALRPQGHADEVCDLEVLRTLKRRSLAKLRQEIEPVSIEAYARFLSDEHGLDRPQRGPDALLAALDRLEGYPLALDVLEEDVLPARVDGFSRGDLDALMASGWIRYRAMGPDKVALYSAEREALLAPAAGRAEGPHEDRLRAVLAERGASFFPDLLRATGSFGPDVLAALHRMLFCGEVVNDTLAPLRSLLAPSTKVDPRRGRPSRMGRSPILPGSEGRWSLTGVARPSETERRAALVQTLLHRHGVLLREAASAEGVVGGFGALYEILRAMEEGGRARRGWFVHGLGATQFALPGSEERLRSFREPDERDHVVRVLAATDPAAPWGSLVPWPETAKGKTGARPQRARGAQVVVHRGVPLAWLGRTERSLLTFALGEDLNPSAVHDQIALALAGLIHAHRRRALLIGQIDGEEAERTALGAVLLKRGFSRTAKGLLMRAGRALAVHRSDAASAMALDGELEEDLERDLPDGPS
jgi:ATP-dependent Lhr-like helicase